MRLSHGLMTLCFVFIASCSFSPNLSVVDEDFITDHQDIFEGYERGATFSRADSVEHINLYIRRTGSSLWLKPVLYFSTGETSLLADDSFIQIALPRDRLTADKPYTIVSHAGKYLHQTLIWLQDAAETKNLVIDHRVNQSALFFFGLAGEMEVSSWLLLPESQDGEDGVLIVNKRLADCIPEDCDSRIEKILAN